MGRSRARARLGATFAMAVMAGFGLTGCQNLGEKAGDSLLHPSQSPRHHRPQGPTKRAAKAFLHRSFVLFDHGHVHQACRFSESKPYLAVDRDCAAESKRAVDAFHAHGLSAIPDKTVVRLHGTRGTATFWYVVNGQRHSTSSYLRYGGHRWWMTGEPKTGDRGL